MIFIDTCIVIEYLKNNSFLSEYNLDELFISEIVIMELFQGAKNKSDLAFIKKELSVFKVVDTNNKIISLSKHILEKYNLSHNMKIIDAIIASTAMVYDLQLITLNEKDFKFIKQIRLINPVKKI
jgi:tRNA(fMet)-specific endonuclease VapC